MYTAVSEVFRRSDSYAWRVTAGLTMDQAPATKPIETVAVGDRVWAWDFAEGCAISRPVVRLFRHARRPLASIEFCCPSGECCSIVSTEDHPFWVEGQGWTAARQLLAGDRIRTKQGLDDGAMVQSVNLLTDQKEVFNFEVLQAHNYFVGIGALLVHNDSETRQSRPDKVREQGTRYTLGIAYDAQEWHTGKRMATAMALGSMLYSVGTRYVAEYEAERTARAETADEVRSAVPSPLGSEPLEVRSGRGFAELPQKVVPGSGFVGLFKRWETFEPHDHEVAEAKVIELLGAGEHRQAQRLAYDADIDLSTYSRLVELHAREKVESIEVVVARRLLERSDVRSDIADAIGRLAVLQPLAQVPGLMDKNSAPVMERGRFFFGSIPMEVGWGIAQSLDIISARALPWSAETRSIRDVWGQVSWNLAGSAIGNMASEQAGMFLPSPSATRQVQSLGKWTNQPAPFSTPVGQSFGKFLTELAIGQTVRQAVNWYAHEFVDPSIEPFKDGVATTIGTSAVTLGTGYALTNPAVAGPLKPADRWLFWATARSVGSEFRDWSLQPSPHVQHPARSGLSTWFGQRKGSSSDTPAGSLLPDIARPTELSVPLLVRFPPPDRTFLLDPQLSTLNFRAREESWRGWLAPKTLPTP
jgi:hypothetical protein